MKEKIILLAMIFLLGLSFAYAGNPNNITNENISINLTITNTPPTIDSITFDDSTIDGTVLDLSPNVTTAVKCIAKVTDQDGITDLTGTFNATIYNVSNVNGIIDNSFKYVDSACVTDTNDGNLLANQVSVNCTVSLYWYATPGNWQCNVSVEDNGNNIVTGTSTTRILNELRALDVNRTNAGGQNDVDFGSLAIGANTSTTDYNITIWNTGNSLFDINLEPYAATENDGASMSCTGGLLDDQDIAYSLLDAQAFATGGKTFLTSGAGTDVAIFNLGRQTSGTTLSSFKNVRLGFGINATETGRSGSCSGTLMVTAITNI